jgi:hypothetical protein
VLREQSHIKRPARATRQAVLLQSAAANEFTIEQIIKLESVYGEMRMNIKE